MRNDKLIPGIILVIIGGMFLLANYGHLHIQWGNIWRLWPIFLIIGGVNLVFANNRSAWATILKIAVIVLGFGLLLFGNFGNRFGFPYGFYRYHHDNNNDKGDDWSDDDDDDDDTTGNGGMVKKIEGNSTFSQPYTADVQIAQLNISGGATKYTLNDTTSQLLKADTKEHFGRYEFSHSNNGSTYILNFDMKDKKNHHFDWHIDDKSNLADFKLNVNPIWDISVETGATAVDFDLTKFKIRTLKLSGGAAAFNIKLGQPLEATNVEVSTGMASVNVNIPKNAACEIITDSGLSSTSFEGFIKANDDDNYKTPGFDAAKNKIFINISGGMSSFNVKRY